MTPCSLNSMPPTVLAEISTANYQSSPIPRKTPYPIREIVSLSSLNKELRKKIFHNDFTDLFFRKLGASAYLTHTLPNIDQESILEYTKRHFSIQKLWMNGKPAIYNCNAIDFGIGTPIHSNMNELLLYSTCKVNKNISILEFPSEKVINTVPIKDRHFHDAIAVSTSKISSYGDTLAFLSDTTTVSLYSISKKEWIHSVSCQGNIEQIKLTKKELSILYEDKNNSQFVIYSLNDLKNPLSSVQLPDNYDKFYTFDHFIAFTRIQNNVQTLIAVSKIDYNLIKNKNDCVDKIYMEHFIFSKESITEGNNSFFYLRRRSPMGPKLCICEASVSEKGFQVNPVENLNFNIHPSLINCKLAYLNNSLFLMLKTKDDLSVKQFHLDRKETIFHIDLKKFSDKVTLAIHASWNRIYIIGMTKLKPFITTLDFDPQDNIEI